MNEAEHPADASAGRGIALGPSSPSRRQQFSVKVTEDACRRFRRLAEGRGVTLGELFEQALDALEREAAGRRPIDC